MSRWLHRAASASGVATLARGVFARRGVFVLELHGIARRRYEEVPAAIQPSFTAADLERTLAWLARRFAFLTPDQALAAGARGVLLTFDDGFANNVDQALPLLEKFGAPAIFFVTLQHVEDPEAWLPSIRRGLPEGFRSWPREVARDLFQGMSPEQLRICARHPLVTLGSHTMSHPRLSSCTREDLCREVQGSRQRLQELSGTAVDFFAYPYGDYDRRVAEAVREAAYRAAFVEDPRRLGLPELEIPRVGLYSSDAAYLALKLSGLHRRPWKGLTPYGRPRA